MEPIFVYKYNKLQELNILHVLCKTESLLRKQLQMQKCKATNSLQHAVIEAFVLLGNEETENCGVQRNWQKML